MTTGDIGNEIMQNCRAPLILQENIIDNIQKRLVPLCGKQGDMLELRRDAWRMAKKLRACARAIEEVAETLETL